MYFDSESRQYQQQNILNPPTYTKLEIEEVLKLLPPQTSVTDFGAGTGRLTIPLLKNGHTVTAVDVSRKSLEKLRFFSDKSGFKKLLIANKISKTDGIAGTDVLHHIDINRYFQLFYRNLKPNGVVAFSEPNGFNPFWYLFIWLKLDWREEKGVIYINYFNVNKQLTRAGFSDIRIKGLGLIPGPFCLNNKFLCRFNNWLGNLPLLKLFAYRLIIFARKN